MHRYLATLAALAFSTAVAGQAAAQTYPSKPITLVITFPPGGGADTIGRPLAAVAQQHIGQPMVVINKPGGGGAVGVQFAANAKPDGYTVLYSLNTASEIPQIDELLGRPISFKKEQLTPIGQVAVTPFAVMVNAESPFQTFKDLVEETKRNPDKLQYASAGVYSATHIMWEMIIKATGMKIRHLPTTGGGPVITAVLGKHVDVGHCVVPTVCAPHLDGKKVRILAITADKRIPSNPDVPTLKELGYDVSYAIWHALLVPSATPPEIVATLRKGLKSMVEDPTFVGAMTKLGERVQYLGGEDFQKFWDDDYKKIGAVLKEIVKK